MSVRLARDAAFMGKARLISRILVREIKNWSLGTTT